MTRLILLDSGPLGMAAHPKAEGITRDCQRWLNTLLRQGERIAIPEIADYEVRRELIRAGLTRSVRRLDQLLETLEYIPIDTATMRRASELWAEVRRSDVILAAQAILSNTDGTEVIIATTNVAHLSRFTVSLDWRSIS
jgi:predicted nucleic acid-binding protein